MAKSTAEQPPLEEGWRIDELDEICSSIAKALRRKNKAAKDIKRLKADALPLLRENRKRVYGPSHGVELERSTGEETITVKLTKAEKQSDDSEEGE
jgi:hypothetical protein